MFYILSSWVEINLHTEFQLPRMPGSGPKVIGGCVLANYNAYNSFGSKSLLKWVGNILHLKIDSGIKRLSSPWNNMPTLVDEFIKYISKYIGVLKEILHLSVKLKHHQMSFQHWSICW